MKNQRKFFFTLGSMRFCCLSRMIQKIFCTFAINLKNISFPIATDFQRVNKATNKMNHPKSQPAKDVLDSVKNLPTNGTIAQDEEEGKLYLHLDDDWISNPLSVLKDYGYTRGPSNAHVLIADKDEDPELFGKNKWKVSQLIGKIVDFEVVSTQRVKIMSVDAQVAHLIFLELKSPELSKIRFELTGLSTAAFLNGNFAITVGINLNPSLNLIIDY